MPDHRLHGPHLRLHLRSGVAVAAGSPPAVKRRAIAAVQVGGTKGRLVQALLGIPFARFPARFAGALPLVSLADAPGLAVSDAAAADALDRADAVLEGAISHVIWLIPPPSDGERVSALLVGEREAIGHLRITDLAPAQRPSPSGAVGRRTGVHWPMILDSWTHNGVVVELTDAFDVGRSSPTDLDAAELDDLIADLEETLGEGPDGLVGAHGDLTPWNLRTTADGRRVLFDWEHRTFAPVGYDLVRFLLSTGDGPGRFAALPAEQRSGARPAIEALIALADERDATRRDDELTGWKRADIAAERAALQSMLDLAG